MEKIPKNTETANILIGQVGFLKQPIMGIFRLRTPTVVEGLSEISLPSRFLVLIVGPFRGTSIAEHCELGRALAALFNDKVLIYATPLFIIIITIIVVVVSFVYYYQLHCNLTNTI